MKTFRFIGFALFAILMCLSACSGGGDEPIEPTPKPEDVKSEITIDSNIISNGLSFSDAKGEQSISFTTNENWTLSVASTTSGAVWCTASATSGTKGSVTVKFTVTENKDYENRSVSVTIKSGTASKTFTITQKCTEALVVTTDKYEVGQKGGTIEIEVKANIDYQMEISEAAKDWIKESSSRTLTTYKHKLDIAMNENAEKREGVITFKSGDKVETVKVYQTGDAILLLSQNEYNVSDRGDTISVDIKSNIEYGVQMPNVDWIIDETSSRGLSSHTFKYIINANKTNNVRSAEIVFYDKNDCLKDTLKIFQEASKEILIEAKVAGTLEELLSKYDYTSIINLKIVGEINNDDILYLNKKLYNLNQLDIENTTLGTMRVGPQNVYKLILPKNLKVIQEEAFHDSKLESIEIPASVERIENEAFRYSRNLRKITFQKGAAIQIIEGGYYETAKRNPVGAFSHCESLETIIIPSNVKIIKGGAFYECVSLKNVYFEENSKLEEFEGEQNYNSGRGAFMRCNLLNEITIPKNVKKIGYLTFADCTSLKNVIFEEESQLEIIEGSYYSDSRSFGAFQNCSSLKEIRLPSNLKEIGFAAFKDCTALEYVQFESNSILKYIRGGHGGAVNVPASYGWSFGAFANCNSLKTITIPSTVENIGESTFFGCTSLEEVVFEKNSQIQELYGTMNKKGYHTGVFSGCSSLKSIIIPSSVQIIHSSAFYGCKSLEVVSFENSSNLKSIEGDNENMEYGAFYQCMKLRIFDASNCKQLSNIGGATFYGNTSLNKVKLGTTSPPLLGDKVFHGISESAVLEVPKGTLGTYKNSEKWSLTFKNIEEY